MRKLLLVALIALAGCGFRLRGTADVPFETVYIPNAQTGIALDLKRHIQAATDAKVVDEAKNAQEQKYLAALQDAESFDVQGTTLTIRTKSMGQPLVFTRTKPAP